MSDYFPPEFVYEILLRLPVKSLCRFTLVSKPWYSLITSKAFMSSHLNHTLTTTATASASTTTTSKNSFLLLRRYEYEQEHYTLHIQPDQKTDPAQLPYSLGPPALEFEPPIKSQVGYYRVVGSCDGLICLFDDYFRDKPIIMLWNPSIHKYVTLPIPSIKPTFPHMVVLGLGRDFLTNDYKVVRIVYRKDSELLGFEILPDVEVYSVDKRVWRRLLNPGIQCNIMQFMWSHAYMNGCSYWIAFKKEGGCTNLMLSFDMCNEVFREISLPDVLSRVHAINLAVSVYKESLAVFEYHTGPFARYCNIWMMEKDGVSESWTKLYNIHLLSGVDRAVGFRKNGEILMAKLDEQLFLYDPEFRFFMGLGIYGSGRAFHAERYVESLVLLEGKHELLVDDLSQLVARGCRIEEVN